MEALLRNEQTISRMLDYDPAMRPIGGQICGSKPEFAGQAAKIVEELGFDVVDLNCGCPVDKVTKDGSGSGMLKNPSVIGDVIANMVASVKIPVTVKIRAGWDDSSINAAEITKIAEQAGAVSICIHGRTREQGYKGPANWDHIKACKEAATSIKVIGNGDLFSPEAVARMFAHTKCDAVLVSRGTMGQPWIAQDIVNHLKGHAVAPRTFEERKEALWEHFQIVSKHYPERRAILTMRRVGCWYFKRSGNTKSFREQVSHAQDLSTISTLIKNFTPSGPDEDLEEESDI